MRFWIVVLALLGFGVSFMSIPRIEAATSLHVAPATQTSIPTSTRTEGRPSSGIVIPTPIPIPVFPLDPLLRTRTATSVFVPTAIVTPNTPQQTYTVEAGDSLYKIAQKVYGDGTKYPLILKANNLSENGRLNVGMVLKIPPVAAGAESIQTRLLTPVLTAVPNQSPISRPTTALPTILIPNLSAPTVLSITTTTKTPQPADSILVATPNHPVEPGREGSTVPWGSSSDGETGAIMLMLINLASATLLGSSLVCGLLALVVFESTRRRESKHAMVLRVRPPVAR